jgi:hypothetical protein
MKAFQQWRRVVMMVALAIGGSAVNAVPATASIVRALELPDMVQQADHIAVVDVISQRSDWDAKHERIFSTVELKVVERWKGQSETAEDHLTIIQPGGTVGDLTMTVTGLSAFSPGERAVVFLRGAAHNARVLGLSQGKRPMRYDATARTWWIKQASRRDVTLVKTPGATNPVSTPASVTPNRLQSRVQQTGLDDFRTEVRALIGTPTR